MNTTNPQGVQSKIAQYIAGEVKLNDLMNHNRLSVPVQKRFRFEDTWITMNRTIGEAVLQSKPSELISVGQAAVSRRTSWDKSKKATEIQQKRRNAIAVINQATREMTNGHSWPKMEDWLICPDHKIRYSQFIVPFRKPNESEWLQKSVGNEIRNTGEKTAAITTPVLVDLPVIPPPPVSQSAPELKPDNLISSAKSEEPPQSADKPKDGVTPDVLVVEENSNPKLEHAKSVVASSCPSNYNTPGCFGPLPE